MLFLPDQHLGRNTAVLDLGLSLDDCVRLRPAQAGRRADRRAAARRQGGALAGPLLGPRPLPLECGRRGPRARPRRASARAPRVHSTRSSPRPTSSARPSSSSHTLEAAPSPARPGRVGTELNLVQRLAREHPDQQVVFLDRTVCFCSTMNRIDLPHLVWALETLVDGRVVNQIAVDPEVSRTGPRSRSTGCSRCPASDRALHARADSHLD